MYVRISFTTTTEGVQMTDLATASYRAWHPGFAGQPVVTSLTLPRWLPEAADWPKARIITPSWHDFKAGDWAERYRERIEEYGVCRITTELEEIAADCGADLLVLMCFEADPADCHRQIFADLMITQAGVRVDELVSPTPTK
jgi:hypothetical protein